MLKPIAVSGMMLTITPSAVTGAPAATTPPSTRVSAGGGSVYRGPVAISVPVVSQGSHASTGPATGTLQPTATKGRAEGQYLLREGDKATGMSISATDGSTTITINFEVEVTSAGQTKARSE